MVYDVTLNLVSFEIWYSFPRKDIKTISEFTSKYMISASYTKNVSDIKHGSRV